MERPRFEAQIIQAFNRDFYDERPKDPMKAVDLDTLVRIAIDAGAIIMPFYQDGPEARTKADGSPVTLADEAAEALILAALKAEGAGPVVAEEAVAGGDIPEHGASFYLVDPLDGTKSFVKRDGEFTVNIAYVDEGVPVRGVVYAPALGVLYAGDATGAFRARVVDGTLTERTPLHVAAPQAELKVVASKDHLSDETKAFVARYSVASFVSSGSSLKFCRVAEGEADLYPRLGRTMEWDTAAGHAVVLAAGGRVLTMDGAPLKYGEEKADTFANPYFVACGPFDPFALANQNPEPVNS